MPHEKSLISNRRGFTLAELLVAMVVLTLMISMLSQVMSSAQIGLGKIGNSALRRQDAGTVLANMAKDLRASIRPMNLSFEGADPAAGQFQLLINPPGLVNGPTANICNADTIFWNSSVGSPAGGTGLVGYVLRWGKTPANTPQPLLCRMYLNTVLAQAQLADLQSGLPTGAAPPPPPPTWANTALVDNFAHADIDHGYQGWLADNIIAFYVRALDPEMKPITNYAQTIVSVTDPFDTDPANNYFNVIAKVNLGNPRGTSCVNQSATAQYDSRLGYQYARATDPPNTYVNRYGPALPAAIELVIVAAEPKEIARLNAPLPPVTSGDPAQMWADVNSFMGGLPDPLKKSARVYSTIVPL